MSVFTAVECAWLGFVRPFQIPYHYWQLLPVDAIEKDPWVALLNLHAQPPGLNLLLVLLTGLSDATGLSREALGGALQIALGAVAVAILWRLARRLIRGTWTRRIAMAVLLANPYFYAVWGQLFYTAHEVLLLAWFALAALAFFERPAPSRFASSLVPALLLVYTRSLFHPAWWAAIAALLLILTYRAIAREPARYLGPLLVLGLLLVAWPAKNFLRFDFFGFSSWMGFNLAKGLHVERPVLFQWLHVRELSRERAAILDAAVPAEHRADPGIASARKPDGAPNWNHHTLLEASRILTADTLAHVRDDPSVLLTRALNVYRASLSTYEGRDPYVGILAIDIAREDDHRSDAGIAVGWMRAYEAVVYQRFRDAASSGSPRITTGFSVLFPLLLAAPFLALARRRGSWAAEERVVAVMMSVVAWVIVVALFVDGSEGNRLRFSSMPLLLLSVGWAFDSARRTAGAVRGASAGHGGSMPPEAAS